VHDEAELGKRACALKVEAGVRGDGGCWSADMVGDVCNRRKGLFCCRSLVLLSEGKTSDFCMSVVFNGDRCERSRCLHMVGDGL